MVNGKARENSEPLPIAAYLAKLGVNPLAVAVESNGVVVPRNAFDTTLIDEGARLEIVRMMGGG